MMGNVFRSAAGVSLCSMLLVTCEESGPVDAPVEWIDVPLQDRTYFGSTDTYQQGSYEILVLRNSALEYKLEMKEGNAIS